MRVYYENLIFSSRGLAVPVVVAVIVFLAILAYGIYNYTAFERNMVARLQHSSTAEKLAQGAVFEASNLFNYRILLKNGLDPADKLNVFILAPVRETAIDDLTYYLSPAELRSFELAKKLGARLDWVEFRYEKFRKYFNDPPEPSSFEKSCAIPSDPLERFGGLMISAKATYRSSSRVFCCRYEVKTSQTLVPVLSKFTLFMKESDEEHQNHLHMASPVKGKDEADDAGGGFDPPANPLEAIIRNEAFGRGEWTQNAQRLSLLKRTAQYLQGNRGLIDKETKKKRMPIVFIHHPDDMAPVTGFGKTHADIREMLPMDPSVTPKGGTSGLSYRPSMTDRGWVYMGGSDPKQVYFHNVSPGKINPPAGTKPEPEKDHLFFGNAFMLREYGIPLSAKLCRDMKIPYQFAFSDFNPPGKLDYIIRTTQIGVYWVFKDTVMETIMGNFYKTREDMPADSSLLQIAGDMQVRSYNGERPSGYLDRRSPTIVFGKVFRFFMQVGQIAQNCVHPPGSPYTKEMLPNGLHEFPYPAPSDHAHPQARWLPYFEMGKDNQAINNKAVDITDPDWNGAAIVNDRVQSDFKTPTPKDADYQRMEYNINSDIFKCYDNQHNQVYKFFMTKPICEPFNRTNDTICANSGPGGGIFKTSGKYSLKQDLIGILSSYPDAQIDDLFFYGDEGLYGNCVYGNRLKIGQYTGKTPGDNAPCDKFYPNGIFRGALQAIELVSPDYRNPLKAETAVETANYDLRLKADYIFDSYAEFEKYFTRKGEGGSMELTGGGVFYIDSDAPVDLSKGKSVSDIVFHENIMLITKKDVKVPSIHKSKHARQMRNTISIVSATGNVVIAGSEIEASLNSLGGTIFKEVDFFQIFGNITMKKMIFDYSKQGDLFSVPDYPPGKNHRILGSEGLAGTCRLSVVYDPALDPCNAENASRHYNYTLSSRQTFWRVTSD